ICQIVAEKGTPEIRDKYKLAYLELLIRPRDEEKIGNIEDDLNGLEAIGSTSYAQTPQGKGNLKEFLKKISNLSWSPEIEFIIRKLS
ncbi:unnamed protein product, partial [marine sediment metagenome]